jgi:excinuclease ABC subunit C
MYFGPYSSAGAVRETMRFLLKVFPVRTCKDSVFANRTRPCILHDVGKCCGPCVLPVPREEYAKLVGSVALFLRGKKEEVKRALEERMEKFSDRMEFERAAMVRDRVAALDATLERQQVVSHGQSDRDVIAVASRQGRSFVVVMEHRDGVLSGTFDNYVKNHEHDDGEVLYGFLAQHFDAGRVIPPEILVSTMPDDSALLEEWLRERRGGAVTIHQPQRGDRLRLIESAAENARLGLERRLSGEQTSGEVLGELARKLGLESPPQTIECVDISNIMGVMAVGSLVRFEDALPDKDGYRRFRIRTVDGSNDYAMMREVLERRFRPEGTRAKGRPDLLLVDGGKGQLSSARRVLDELGVRDVALAAIAKSRLKKSPISAPDDQVGARKLFDDAGPEIAPEAYERVRTEERIFLPGRKNPVTFSRNSPALFILQRIRDEAHRFAITYHKQLRKKANRRSILEEIPGVGEKRRRALLRHFGSLVAVKAASVREIAAVGGVGEAAARMIVEFLEAGKPAGKQPDLIDTCAEDTTPVD